MRTGRPAGAAAVTFPAGPHNGHVSPLVGPRSLRRVQDEAAPSHAHGGSRQDDRPGTVYGTSLYQVEWSAEEQAILEAGLQRFSAEKISSLSRYIRVAATLPHKSVRDVALRVRWIGRKDTPRKQRTKMPPPPPVDAAPLPPAPKRSRTPKEPRTEASRPGGSHAYSLGAPAASHMGGGSRGGGSHGALAHGHAGSHRHRGGADFGHFPPPLPLLSSDELAAQGGHVTGTTTELLDANVGLAHGIKASLGASALGDSATQLCTLRNNILAILHRMSTQGGIMTQMPPLPVRPNLELAATVLPLPLPGGGGGGGGVLKRE